MQEDTHLWKREGYALHCQTCRILNTGSDWRQLQLKCQGQKAAAIRLSLCKTEKRAKD